MEVQTSGDEGPRPGRVEQVEAQQVVERVAFVRAAAEHVEAARVRAEYRAMAVARATRHRRGDVHVSSGGREWQGGGAGHWNGARLRIRMVDLIYTRIHSELDASKIRIPIVYQKDQKIYRLFMITE